MKNFAGFEMQIDVHPAEVNHNPGNVLRMANALYDLYTDTEYEKASFNIVPCYRDHSEINITSLYPDRHHQRSNKGTDNEVCHFPEYSGDVDSEDDFNKECPWRFKIDYNESRIPRSIVMAMCECQHCHRGRCEHIFTYIPVLIEECHEYPGICEYTKSVLEVPVGCSCVHHRRAVGAGRTVRRRPCRQRIVMEE